jgi:hypothetical protein
VEYARWLQDCRSIRSGVSGDMVEEIDVPARAMAWHRFKDTAVGLGLYRLKDSSSCSPNVRE